MSQPPGTNVAVVAVNKSAHATVDETSLMFSRWAKKKLVTVLKSPSKKCGGGAGITIAGHDPLCLSLEARNCRRGMSSGVSSCSDPVTWELTLLRPDDRIARGQLFIKFFPRNFPRLDDNVPRET